MKIIEVSNITKPPIKDENYLNVAEMFVSLQGEGVTCGTPSLFIRLQKCSLRCNICDTDHGDIGNPYSCYEIFRLLEEYDIINRLKTGRMHMVFTGGSPLIQQKRIIEFIDIFIELYKFKPFIEIENECVIIPLPKLKDIVNVWNNSPKLSFTGNPRNKRYRINVLKTMSWLPNSYFKFVISNDSDWNEIQKDFLDKDLIRKEQIILMPLGINQEELNKNRNKVIEIALRENVRYSDRLHIIVWNDEKGK